MDLTSEVQRFGRWWWSGEIENPGPLPNLTMTIVIPAYNEATYLLATLESCVNQTRMPDEIIVVDDCSDKDNTGEVARAFAETEARVKVKVLRTPANKGSKAAAQNYALSFITTDVYATIDADTTLAHDALEKALPYFNDPKVGAVCGCIVPRNRKSFYELGRYFEYLYSFNIIKPAQDRIGAMFVASGCFSIFRTHLVREVGISSETIAEDLHLSWLIQQLGYKIKLARHALCYPVDPNNYQEYQKQVFRWNCGFLQNIKVRDGNLFGEHWKRAILLAGGLFIAFLLLLEQGPLFRKEFGHYQGHFIYILACVAWIWASFRILKQWRLAFVTWIYFTLSVLGPVFELAAYFLIVSSMMGEFSVTSFLVAVAISFVLKIFITWIPVIASAYWMSRRTGQRGDVWLAVKGIVPFSLLHYLNTWIFAKAVWKELIRGQSLNKWDKGHAEIAALQPIATDGS